MKYKATIIIIASAFLMMLFPALKTFILNMLSVARLNFFIEMLWR